jgi:4-alpha-glucanotransferase
MAAHREALERAASRCGVECEYTDTWGRRHVASDQALEEILHALGVPAGSDEEIHAALERRDLAEWSRPVDPAVVVFEDSDNIALRVPMERSGESVKLEIGWENGEIQHHWFWLPELAELNRATIAGKEFVAKRLPLPSPLRLGYHELRLYWVKEPELETFGQARFIVCPRRAYAADGRVAGVAVSLYGLRSARNWGCGDFTDLLAAIDAFARAGAQFVALNPLHAIPNRQPYNTSPYLPECSLYRNFLYLDVERVPGFAADPAARPEIEALRATELVEYERVAKLKLTALRGAFFRFRQAGGSAEFDAYVQAEGKPLHDFAEYSALWTEIHAAHPEIWLWTNWPAEFQDPNTASTGDRDAVLFYKFLQWQVDRQLAEAQARALARGMRIGLYHDLALATDRFGADLWANRRFYLTSAQVGAPPDELAPSGQEWGFPPPNRDAHREDGYERFARSIRNNARHGGALRIDHVMRFFRLFWIPEGLRAAQGAYVRDYVDDLLGVLALESVREKFIVIGEDLGTVQEEVRQRLSQTGILGYRLLWFERNVDGTFRLPHEYREHAAVSTTTHDLPTLSGFPRGCDIEARRTAGLIDDAGYQAQWAARREETVRLEQALERAGFPGDPLGFVLATPCTLAIVNQEDLTGETEQQNLPASTWQHPNWRRKMKVAVEDLGPIAGVLRRKIEESGR